MFVKQDGSCSFNWKKFLKIIFKQNKKEEKESVYADSEKTCSSNSNDNPGSSDNAGCSKQTK
jgi:hypothetical protein